MLELILKQTPIRASGGVVPHAAGVEKPAVPDARTKRLRQ